MHEPMSERQYVFSDKPIIFYRYYIDSEIGKDPYWDKCFHNHRKLQFECEDHAPTDNEYDPRTSTGRTEDNFFTITWEADFDYKVFEPRQETSPDTDTTTSERRRE